MSLSSSNPAANCVCVRPVTAPVCVPVCAQPFVVVGRRPTEGLYRMNNEVIPSSYYFLPTILAILPYKMRFWPTIQSQRVCVCLYVDAYFITKSRKSSRYSLILTTWIYWDQPQVDGTEHKLANPPVFSPLYLFVGVQEGKKDNREERRFLKLIS